MSLKGPLRRLSRDVEWLENEGTFRHLEILVKIVEMKQEMADNLARDKETAAEFERAGLLKTLKLPPPSWAKRPAPAPRPEPILLGVSSASARKRLDATLRAAPQDEGVRVEPPSPLPPSSKPPEPAPPPEPILRDATLRVAPQDEGMRVESPPEPARPHPEEPSEARRLEGCEPAPRSEPTLRDAPLRGAPQGEGVRVEMPPSPPDEPPEPPPPLVQPFSYDPPPEMQIRPVQWRQRGPQDYEGDGEDMYGKCIVDYDPLGYLDDDD